MKSKRKIILIGMMGSGKTTIAKKLSKKLDIDVYDCDEIFVKKFNMSINDYFDKFGEMEFRKEESNILNDIMKNKEFIISSGGGIILNEYNRKIIFDNGILSIYLKTTPNVIYERLKNDKTRPLLLVDNIKEKITNILKERKMYYNKANIIIENDDLNITNTINKIINKINAYENN